jgi:hypothetical protein
MTQGVGPEFKPRTTKKRKRKEKAMRGAWFMPGKSLPGGQI